MRAQRPYRHPLSAVLAPIALLATLLAGCGSHAVVQDSSVVRLTVADFAISPQDVQVRPGRIKLVVLNTGIVAHDVKVETLNPLANGNANPLGGTEAILPGHSAESAKLLLSAGTYKLVDTIANHVDLGAYGTLVVKGAPR